MIMNNAHKTVLLEESVEALNIDPNGIYIDGTYGRGGHSRLILSRLGINGRLIAIDRDPEAVREAQKVTDPRFEIIHDCFSSVAGIVKDRNLTGQISGMLLDLGVSSPQLDESERGFSFMRDGPLDMRMDPTQGLSAADWLNQADESDIAWVLKEFGEEKFSKRIARAIVQSRNETPISTTLQLAKLISEAVPFKDPHKHPATRSFQGIRIYINSELQEVEQALAASIDILKDKGRLAVISFHSLEDRIVKRFMKKESSPPDVPFGLPIKEEELSRNIKFSLVGKPVKPSDEEIKENVRSRSALLRVAQRERS